MAFQTVDLYSSGITIGMMENSPEREEGENPRATLRFRAIGSDDAGAAYAAMIDYLRTYWWQDDPGRIAAWQIPLKTCAWRRSNMRPPTTSSVRSSFPTKILLRTSTILSTNTHLFKTRTINSRRRGTSHITHSLETLAAIPLKDTSRNFDRGIGLNEDNS